MSDDGHTPASAHSQTGTETTDHPAETGREESCTSAPGAAARA
ncbi:hypothetical protein [Frigidibacter sp. MR17.24]